jgi:uncharacterized membrane protein
MKKPAARRPTPPRRQTQPQDNSPSNGHVARVESHQWAGPLPPPAILDHFNQVAENGAERIFKQWETESDHRRKMERRDFGWSVAEGMLGKVFAFVFVIAALGLAAYALSLGANWLAAFLAAGTIGSVVAAFVSTNRPRPNGK